MIYFCNENDKAIENGNKIENDLLEGREILGRETPGKT
jgi:hypothetical protein